ncbi:hypothetical protein IPL68_05495 [Candidatus Saccharibacteria bacterium]|nr:MAG: hypothetical protein IPL68_05495 [Candidatus Saccharibacteria bacterium]
MVLTRHPHLYQVSPSLEFLDLSTLHRFEEAQNSDESRGSLTRRADIQTEIILHPDVPISEKILYQRLRQETDEALFPKTVLMNLSDTTTALAHVFLPVVLGLGDSVGKRWQEVYRRSHRLFDACENAQTKDAHAIGAAAEAFVNIGLCRNNVLSIPCLGRENMGFQYEGKLFAMDALVRWRAHGKTKRYRAQIKFNSSASYDYHPDIVLLCANPPDAYHVPREQFIDFARGILPNIPSSIKEGVLRMGRIDTLLTTLRKHPPSRIPKVKDRCMLTKAA